MKASVASGKRPLRRAVWVGLLGLAGWPGAAWGQAGAAVEPAAWREPTAEVLRANLAAVRGAEAAAEQLLVNGGFEEGEAEAPAKWSRSFWPAHDEHGQAIAQRAIRRTTAAAYTGRYALCFDTGVVDLSGEVLGIRQVIAAEALAGQRLRYSLRSLSQTAPGPGGNPLVMTLRQYRGRELLDYEVKEIYQHERQGWVQSSLESTVLPGVERVDVKVSVRNPLPDGRATVRLIDELRLAVATDPPVQVELAFPEAARGAGWLPLRCVLGPALAARGDARVRAVLVKGEEAVREVVFEAARQAAGYAVRIDDVPAGRYTLVVQAEAAGVGPVGVVRRAVVLYDGPYGG